MISIWVTESAPWRFDVPMQSEPVSPPPTTTTCLPCARIGLTFCSGSPVTRRFCWPRNSMAKCTPSSSRPGIGRSRGFSAPPAMAIASYWLASSSTVMSLPTCTLVWSTTPSAIICSTRRSMVFLSSLKFGMP